MAVNLFTELLNTVLDREEGKPEVTVSYVICEPALGFLYQMADFTTVARCLDKLREERRRAALGDQILRAKK